MKRTASYGFHKAFYKALIIPFDHFLRLRFRFTKEKAPELPDHFLLITNHVTNYDPFIVGVVLKRQMYYVATEHLFSLGWKTRMIEFLADPIPRPKGGNAASAVMEILHRLRDGKSVCLFAEGNTSWDGCTASFPESTGKMIRTAKVPLVTFKIEGGYFGYPRWSYGFRKGPVTGHMVRVYQPEELRAMTPEEINAHVAEDIFEDAYARQEQDPRPYKGKALSKGLEHVLLVCPKCHRIGSLTSTADGFSCACGLTGRYDEYCRLSGEGFSFTTIKAWDAWQKEWIAGLPREDGTVLASDEDMVLLQVEGHKRTEIARGTLSMSARQFSLASLSWSMEELASLEVRLHGIVSFSLTDGRYFELKKAADSDYSGRKYKLLFDAFAGNHN